MTQLRLFLLSLTLLVLGTTAAAAVLLEPEPSGGSTATSTTTTDAKSVVDLESLSDAELEAICYNLGFQLRETDEVTGAKMNFTHAEYVEAARQCLAVQAQMDEVLDQNPELMAEYLAEVERMKAAELAEQERLLRQIEQLEGELAAATDTPSSDVSVGSAFGVQKVAASQDSDGTVNNITKDEATLSELIETPAGETITSSPNDKEIENTSDVDQGSFIDDDSTTKQIAETSSQSQRRLPPAIQAVLDKYVPPNVQILIRNFWIKIQQDVKQLVKLQIRLVKAFVGHVAQRMEERKAATTAKEATAELES